MSKHVKVHSYATVRLFALSQHTARSCPAFSIAVRATLAINGSVDCVAKGSAMSCVVERSGGFTISLAGKVQMLSEQ